MLFRSVTEHSASIRREIAGPNSPLACLSFPTIFQDPAAMALLEDWTSKNRLTRGAVVLVFLETADTHQKNLDNIIASAETCRKGNPSVPLCFLFSRSVNSVSLRNTCVGLASKFSNSFFGVNLVWEDLATRSHIISMANTVGLNT